MQRFRSIVLLVAVVLVIGGVSPGWSRGDLTECQYVLMVEQCRKSMLVLNVGGDEILGRVSLEDWNYAPNGVDFATVPGYGEYHSFVTQGPFLHVVDIQWDTPVRTIDVGQVSGLQGVTLNRIQVAAPVTVGQETVYPIYAAATFSAVPWVLIFDQEALLDDSSDPSSALLASGPIHADCADCYGIALDVAVGGPPPGGGVQEAYVSVLDRPELTDLLRIYRVVLHEDFSIEVSLEPWNDEGLPYDGSLLRVNGLDYDSTGTQPFGVFQTTSVVRNLADGQSSCTLPGDPTDVAVWGPGSGMENPNFHFVTSVHPLSTDMLIGFPAGGCPVEEPAALAFPAIGSPRALALSSVTSNTPWIYTANKEGRITAVQLQLSSDSEAGDRIDVLEAFDIVVNGDCPYEVAIRDESYLECAAEIGESHDAKPPKVDCDEDPDDPRCKRYIPQMVNPGDETSDPGDD